MSDNDNIKGKARGKGKPGPSWSDHEVLIYLLSTIEATGVKLDFANAPAPAGRNANGCSQKMFKIKNQYRAEIDAIKNGDPLPEGVAATTPKTPAGRKRKAKVEDAANGEEETPTKKRGRAKKSTAVVEPEPESETSVKDEPEPESEGSTKDEPEGKLEVAAEI